MTPSDDPDRRPVGPLGRAFADLAADAPPTSLSADAVIATAHQESHRRHRWVLGTGVAAAVVAVSTLIGVSVSQTGSGDSSTAASESTAVAGGSAPALASSPPSKPGSAAGGDAEPDEPDGQAGEGGATAPEAAPSSADCLEALSSAQERAVLAALPGLDAAECAAAESEGDVIAAAAFAGDGVTVTVEVAAGAGDCPSDDQAACATVDGHPDVLVLATPGDRPPNEGTSTTVIGENGGRTVTITVERDGATGDLPYAIEDLATLAETLLDG